jgi:FKBP-type peptidyl-prolyl cis-trans isomerase FkpA
MRKYFFMIALLSVFALSANAQTGLQTTPKGAQYQIYTNNPGPKIKLNDIIYFNFIQKTDKDSVLYSSFKTGKPQPAQIRASQNVADLMEIFPLLALNDSAMVKVPTDSLFKGHEEARPPFFPKGSALVFVIKIVKVQSLEEAMAERTAMTEKLKGQEGINAAKFISDAKLSPVTTASGLKYIITTPSKLARPMNGDTILVNYAGSLLNGQVFDTSIQAVAKAAGVEQPGRPYEPIPVVLGEHRVIPGWEEGLALLGEGSKAKFIIPSKLGYGEQAQGPIPPYATLLFDIEIVKVKRAKHVPVAAKPGVKSAVKKTGVKKTAVSKKKN